MRITMSNNDYFVVVYTLLKRLYSCLKKDKQLTNKELNELSSNLQVENT